MWEFSSEHFYANIIATLLAFTTIIVGVFHSKYLLKFQLLVYYSFFSFIQGLIALTVIHFDYEAKRTGALIEHTLNIFLVLEFVIFYIILFQAIRTEVIKKIMQTIFFIFISYVGFIWLTSDAFSHNPNQLTIIESFLILIPVLCYYYELFYFPPEKNLARDPTFWVITGMFLLFSTIIPLFVFKEKINHHFYQSYKMVYTINFVSYCFFFSCLLNALLCQIKNLKYSSYS